MTQSDHSARIRALETRHLEAHAEIKVARAAAGASLGAGKGNSTKAKRVSAPLVELGPCQALLCPNKIMPPSGMTKRSLCKACYELFVTGPIPTQLLRDGRTATRTPAKVAGARGKITIASFRCRPVVDFNEFHYDIPIFTAIMASSKFPPSTAQFAHLDTCTRIGAGVGPYFLGSPLRFITMSTVSTPLRILPLPNHKLAPSCFIMVLPVSHFWPCMGACSEPTPAKCLTSFFLRVR